MRPSDCGLRVVCDCLDKYRSELELGGIVQSLDFAIDQSNHSKCIELPVA